MSAASQARHWRPELDILVFERSPHISYSACRIPYFVGHVLRKVEAFLNTLTRPFAKSAVTPQVDFTKAVFPASIIEKPMILRTWRFLHDHPCIAQHGDGLLSSPAIATPHESTTARSWVTTQSLYHSCLEQSARSSRLECIAINDSVVTSGMASAASFPVDTV